MCCCTQINQLLLTFVHAVNSERDALQSLASEPRVPDVLQGGMCKMGTADTICTPFDRQGIELAQRDADNVCVPMNVYNICRQ